MISFKHGIRVKGVSGIILITSVISHFILVHPIPEGKDILHIPENDPEAGTSTPVYIVGGLP